MVIMLEGSLVLACSVTVDASPRPSRLYQAHLGCDAHAKAIFSLLTNVNEKSEKMPFGSTTLSTTRCKQAQRNLRVALGQRDTEAEL